MSLLCSLFLRQRQAYLPDAGHAPATSRTNLLKTDKKIAGDVQGSAPSSAPVCSKIKKMAEIGDGTQETPNSYIRSIVRALLTLGPSCRTAIEEHVKGERGHFTGSIFWETLGRMLGLDAIKVGSSGTVRANWDQCGNILEEGSSAEETPEKRPAELTFDVSLMHLHFVGFKASGNKTACVHCGKKEATHKCSKCGKKLCPLKSSDCFFTYHATGGAGAVGAGRVLDFTCCSGRGSAKRPRTGSQSDQ